MNQVQWFDRTFDFNYDQNIMPSIIERLEGTGLRLADKLSKIPRDMHTRKIGGTWSILENVGHLTDLEALWQQRLNDILSGKQVMAAADLENKKTHESEHNQKDYQQHIIEFNSLRNYSLSRLRSLKHDDVFKSALHPRLNKPMRMMDLFLFVAEHDDHHLARITEIRKIIKDTPPGP